MLDFINPPDSKLIPPGEVPSLTNKPLTQVPSQSSPPPRKNFHPKDLAVDTIIRWQADPVEFVTELFGHKLKDGEMDEWQKDFMRSLLVHDAVAVRSCHGPGKSATLSWIIIWWMLLMAEPRIACTAPTGHQLNDVLWGEITKWYKLLPDVLKAELEVKNERVEATRNPKEYYCVARTARKDQPEAFQGFHAGNMLFIADEASGVDDIIFQVGEGAMSTEGAKTILTGNPTRTSGYFYDAFHKMRGSWYPIKVSAHDAKMVTQKYIDDMAKKYGEDSNVYRVRVLGEFPNVDDDSVISLALCEAAMERDVGQVPGEAIWGVDVARFGDDTSALAKRKRNTLLEPVKEWKGKDIMQTAGIIYNEWKETAPRDRPFAIMVDTIGLGAGVADRLRELGLPARDVNVSEQPAIKDKFLRLRDELWWRAREWLEQMDCKMAQDEDLVGELTAPKYEITSAGKIQVESKQDLKKRGVVSPNRADAFNLTFAVPDSSAKRSKPLNYQKVRWV